MHAPPFKTGAGKHPPPDDDEVPADPTDERLLV
jgi:hypothetical protein